ncbi:NAD/NADP octopine/nopaline dehydrogenase [Gaiella occulta]|uniref:NAD/NADP octopine/nopaline dehydrogenase n=1 Tax=Gaiella occulta TaxID=1002870 RepID=A0A7M2Z155_9ACTN|nr:NAD/NADP octopine/nopaline dehydrogenase family protein [Gaiella occulta]RDI75531.1 NAD/NADP octopine/nopaline dehydrogenase [Gaiella occulta]
MTVVCVIGAGAGGAAAVVELTLAGHELRWWNGRHATIAPFREAGGVRYEGVLGEGFAGPAVFADSLAGALAGADVAMVCLPALAHEAVAGALVDAAVSCPILLNPGHTGGALHVAAVFRERGAVPPPLVEFSTLTYVARKPDPGSVRITGAAGCVRAACLPGGEDALALAHTLYPTATPVRDVIASSLANVNLVLHTPGAILSAAWVEATGGEFRFYVDAMTPGVARSIATLDRERLAVAAAFGHELPPLVEEMLAIGTVDDADAVARGDVRTAIAGGEANRLIRAPDSLDHRYYCEDFGYGLVPMLELARIGGVETPYVTALVEVASALRGEDLRSTGLTAERLGISGLDRDSLLELVRATA